MTLRGIGRRLKVMVEIKFGAEESGGSGSSNSGGMDIDELFDQLEKAEERLRNNPGLRKMLGVDLEQMGLSDNEPAGGSDSGGNDVSGTEDIDAKFFEDLLGGMVEAGYGDYSLEQVYTYIQNNPQEVNQLIEQQI